MGKRPRALFKLPIFLLIIGFTHISAITAAADNLTKSVGEPWRGKLINGIKFPSDLGGYQVMRPSRTYTTPEVAAGVLDAIDEVRRNYPGTCDVVVGDFSRDGGGWLKGHRSHRNGRDVDIGHYAKGNRQLQTFSDITRGELDVAKTWCLIEGLLKTGRVEKIFMDRRLQRVFHRHALKLGTRSPDELDRLFVNSGNIRGSGIIQHWGRHRVHLHVRFYAPWSTLAGRIKRLDPRQRAIIATAQQAYIPKKLYYQVQGSEEGLAQLASSLGVDPAGLAKWNGLRQDALPAAGTDLVYYRRGFELEPMRLASLLNSATDGRVLFADLETPYLASLAASVVPPSPVDMRALPGERPDTHQVRRGETLWRISRQHGVPVAALRRLNNLGVSARIKPGQVLTISRNLTPGEPPPRQRPEEKAARFTHVVRNGDTLWSLARKYQTSTQALLRLNQLSMESVLRPGMRIIIPNTGTN